MMRDAVVLMAVVVAATAMRQNPSFRALTTRVAVDVNVRSGNVPVAGLTAADFVLTDNGVTQRIEDIGLADVPVDVTLVVDVSGSVASEIAKYRRDVTAIAGMLRPIDRLRVITLESAVHEIIPIVPAGAPLAVDGIETGRLSSVYDGVASALLRVTEPGRRHLIIAYTDGIENRSILTGDQLRLLGQGSDAVLHLVAPIGPPYIVETDKPCSVTPVVSATLSTSGPSGPVSMGSPASAHAPIFAPGPSRSADLTPCETPSLLQQTVEATGGSVHTGSELAGPFKNIFRDFLSSYVLYFQPTNVSAGGFHRLSVKVTSGHYTVHARRGYFAGGSQARRD